MMSLYPHAVFLDLDDTIIDDSSTVDGGWRTAIDEHADGLDAEKLTAAVFAVRDWYWSDSERHRVGRQDLRAASTWIGEEALRRIGHADSGLARRLGLTGIWLDRHGTGLPISSPVQPHRIMMTLLDLL